MSKDVPLFGEDKDVPLTDLDLVTSLFMCPIASKAFGHAVFADRAAAAIRVVDNLGPTHSADGVCRAWLQLRREVGVVLLAQLIDGCQWRDNGGPDNDSRRDEHDGGITVWKSDDIRVLAYVEYSKAKPKRAASVKFRIRAKKG